MPKNFLFFSILIVTLLTAYLTLVFNHSPMDYVPKAESEVAINQAKHLYKQKRETGEDLSNGPCLSNDLMPDWVVDIVHNPRTTDDDLPENQCPSLAEGRAKHFVELDLDGNLVRIY